MLVRNVGCILMGVVSAALVARVRPWHPLFGSNVIWAQSSGDIILKHGRVVSRIGTPYRFAGFSNF